MSFGFFRLSVFSPRLGLGDCAFNSSHTINLLEQAQAQQCGLALFPELGITGYTCADLFHQTALLEKSNSAILAVIEATKKFFDGMVIIGAPISVDSQLFNCAIIIHKGKVLGIVPKSYLPTYKEFYERRYFSPAANLRSTEILLFGQSIPMGADLLFVAQDFPELIIGVEICEDLWVPIPPSSFQALAGATLLTNLSASNDIIGKAPYRKNLVLGQSARNMAVYAYSSSGVYESSTDLVFGGHCLIAENGQLISENSRFNREDSHLIADVDLERVINNRRITGTWADNSQDNNKSFRKIAFQLHGAGMVDQSAPSSKLLREIIPHPFVPANSIELKERCDEIFQIQVAGLAKRLENIGNTPITLGVSGGLDSTLALMVTCKTLEKINRPLSNFKALTMPGFGTTSRTLENAKKLMAALGVSFDEIDIRPLCFEEMKAMNHKPFEIEIKSLDLNTFIGLLKKVPEHKRHDLIFENVQARRRTSLLMNRGFVIGTGDLSELALGWCTFNADHMSMYNPNSSIPKTLVKFLVEWVAQNSYEDPIRNTLLDIAQTVISPELLPLGENGQEIQSTEASVGPYELHDFFLYHWIRNSFSSEKILFLATQTKFHKPYTHLEIKQCLEKFMQRFFSQQYKRSTLPDGPKVGTVSLSPRGDWRMPSDINHL
ncbi:MAG: NAD(+) synthase [Planctomycetes bacterium]|nr:NAD(+) synthase [Planctomycetota bacterium]NBY03061.1 NAD(+) synthase [Planctomycetota bacterium]